MRRENQNEAMAEPFVIDGKTCSSRNVLIIAELGTSHGGDLGKAKALIDAAATAGADCIKLQMVYAHEILHPRTGEVPLPGGSVRLYDTFKKLEQDPGFYLELRNYIEERGLLFLCTPFGLQSAEELARLRPRAYKIASPELNYTGLLRAVAQHRLPVFLSAGVSTLGDIEEALHCFPANTVCLLHCVTAYPAPEADYNLNLLPHLSALFGVAVGVSDHSLDPELVPSLAAAMGSAAIEKHFCLSRDDPGLDDPIALIPADFARMVRAVRRVSALEQDAAIELVSREKGAGLVRRSLGPGVKTLAPSEAANYGRTNRSLHAVRDIMAGEVIQPDMIAVLRTEKILRPGLPPSWEEKIRGRTARSFIPAGEGIRFEDL
jgi:sialic acid synthase SpsE